MKLLRLVATVFCLALIGAAFSPSAKADAWDKKTVVTFSQPVQLPGVHKEGVTVLPAGTYVFKLAGTMGNRHIVQIFSEDETTIYATALAIPNSRLETTGETVITFHEQPAGQPNAIRAWFYPGQQWGAEFVYPKTQAAELAKASGTPVPEMAAPVETKPEEPAVVSELEKAPVKAVEPSGEEVELSQIVTPPPAHEPLVAAMPKTASPLPLIALFGLLALGGALTLRVAETRVR